jgi:N-methylhydantoinase A
VFQWTDLPAEFALTGPAIVEHPETTIYIGPAQSMRLDNAGNLSIDLT